MVCAIAIYIIWLWAVARIASAFMVTPVVPADNWTVIPCVIATIIICLFIVVYQIVVINMVIGWILLQYYSTAVIWINDIGSYCVVWRPFYSRFRAPWTTQMNTSITIWIDDVVPDVIIGWILQFYSFIGVQVDSVVNEHVVEWAL